MKQILTQYLSSLKESGELDAILPDVLRERGFSIYSEPQKGAKQYGVDLAAVGIDPKTDQETLFLITIKSGDLNKGNWNSDSTAVRQSLDQILGTYVKHFVPKDLEDKPINVVVCIGGTVQQSVRLEVTDFYNEKMKTSNISITEWNGDVLAEMLLGGVMSESIFPPPFQSAFRKTISMIEEPDTCLRYFRKLLHLIYKNEPKTAKERLRAARQVYLATWVVFSWARDVQNIEAAYRISSLATLHLWHWCNPMFGKTKLKTQLVDVMQSMLGLETQISSAYNDTHIKPFASSLDLLSESVNSPSNVDVNLNLFEALGRVSLFGLWLQCRRMLVREDASDETSDKLYQGFDFEIKNVSNLICDMISNNLTLHAPIRDDHAIEITLTCMFFELNNDLESIRNWVKKVTISSVVNHETDRQYPCIYTSYPDLVKHPQLVEGYKQKATSGSVLYPTLAVWLAKLNEIDTFRQLSEFYSLYMQHSTWQLWEPDEATEQNLYLNSNIHGKCVCNINVSSAEQALFKQLEDEIAKSDDFNKLSAIRYDHWPIVLMACRLFRLPVPIHFFTLGPQPDNSS